MKTTLVKDERISEYPVSANCAPEKVRAKYPGALTVPYILVTPAGEEFMVDGEFDVDAWEDACTSIYYAPGNGQAAWELARQIVAGAITPEPRGIIYMVGC